MGSQEQYIAYYRVSTERQGQSGLGLEAQKDAVHSFIRQGTILQEYTDVESGKNDQRPELVKAIEHVKQSNGILVIAKLDRLSRNLTFISTLMDSRIRFVCADMPDANEFTIHIFAALAQWERKRISERTRAALAQLKKKGVKLGSPVPFKEKNRRKGTEKLKELALLNQNNVKAKFIIDLLKSSKSFREIAEKLNSAGFKTSRNKIFHAEQVRRLATRK